jgi:hypothetical protein
MQTQFYLVFNLRNPGGDWQTFAKFFLGNNGNEARRMFRKLKRIPEVQEEYPLSIDFMEIRNGLPVNLDVLNCTLEQLAENSKMVTKELFKLQLAP